jgi:hypothetical protein
MYGVDGDCGCRGGFGLGGNGGFGFWMLGVRLFVSERSELLERSESSVRLKMKDRWKKIDLSG